MARRFGTRNILRLSCGVPERLEAEGMRERKKRERREAIAARALRLFIENGFEHVSMREIAQVADVSEPTVFNYFPTKENLVFNEDRERDSRCSRPFATARLVPVSWQPSATWPSCSWTGPPRNRHGLVPRRAG